MSAARVGCVTRSSGTGGGAQEEGLLCVAALRGVPAVRRGSTATGCREVSDPSASQAGPDDERQARRDPARRGPKGKVTGRIAPARLPSLGPKYWPLQFTSAEDKTRECAVRAKAHHRLKAEANVQRTLPWSGKGIRGERGGRSAGCHGRASRPGHSEGPSRTSNLARRDEISE